ncbi:MAG: DUF4835 family protein [Bacteroidaceae bacterium]|nr:DUF4835 family protein [Bacteroidaceae bacterium]
MFKTLRNFLLGLLLSVPCHKASAQELNARITINHDAVSNTKVSVFEALQKQLTELMNTRHWTGLRFAERERIECSFLITVATYSETDNSFTASLIVTASRPVFGSSYKTTVFSTKDADFNFMFQEYDNIEFRIESIDNNLTAMMAYWAYMIIGLDLDTFAPMGGTEILQQAARIVDDSQTLGYPGWKPFENSRNRHALVNDYLDGGLEPYRQMQYDYHRCGLDSMHISPQAGRERIGRAMTLLKEAHESKPMSMLPQIFTDYKRDEIVNIFAKQGSSSERDAVYDIVFKINASQNTYWDELKK